MENSNNTCLSINPGNRRIGSKTRTRFLICAIVVGIGVFITFVTGVLMIYDFSVKNYCMTENCKTIAATLIHAIDRSIDPCDNFYDYVCGRLIKDNPISEWGMIDSITKLRAENTFALKKLLDKPLSEMKSEAERKAKIYYDSCKNYKYMLSDLEIVTTNNLLEKIGGWSIGKDFNIDEWSLQTTNENIVKNIERVGALFAWSVDRDEESNTRTVISIEISGLSLLPQYYLEPDNYSDQIKGLLNAMTLMGKALGGDSNKTVAYMKQVVEFETDLANITSQLNPSELAKETTLAELDVEIPFINWTRYYQQVFKIVNKTVDGQTKVLITSPEYLKKLDQLVRKYINSTEGKITLNNYLIWRSLVTIFAFENESEQWYNCLRETDSYMRFATAAISAGEFVDLGTYPMVKGMIHEIREGFIAQLKNLDWIDDETKQAMVAKANAMQYAIGHADFVVDPKRLDEYYVDLDFTPNNYFANKLQIRQFGLREILSLENLPLIWSHRSSDVNAFNMKRINTIKLSDGILQIPFIDIDRPKSMNYGSLGEIIAHEFTHAFDDSGREYDLYGNKRQWWSNSTINKFIERSECFVEQYDKYEVDGRNINGRKTLGENIADNGGLRTAYRAYLNSLEAHNDTRGLPGLDLTHEQLFFVSYSLRYCRAIGREKQRELIFKDVHSPNEYRVTGALSNFEEFAKVFNCRKGSRMNPEKKCILW